ncbi:response regulator transcription factor [Parapedobacter sp. 10938]|uniref:response regulator transcription factor n=1 Tax=Parapedobacter flavus TaxID=3110225 RepID=UPI002DBF7190|nr:response regulator transcription factor [Parapedobacter sp. 10938]MEC3881267.1 response regulator transcription factor [Parapedobacter sp. 10938]
MVTIGIIEDDDSIREMLARFFSSNHGYQCVLAADSVEQFMQLWPVDTRIDVVLTDIGLPGLSGIRGVPLIKKRCPSCQVIMLTIYDNAEKIFQSLCAGASGYLLKQTPLPEIKQAVQTLLDGGSPMSPAIARKVVAYFHPKNTPQLVQTLTPRETQVVQAIEEGLSNKEVAIRLSVGLETVKTHIKNIYSKLEVNSRHALISRRSQR